jgi:hypothetical protein
MTDAEIQALAEKITDQMRGPFLAASLPRAVGDALRSEGMHGQTYQAHTMVIGKMWLSMHYMFSPDGTIGLELKDMNGTPVWRGTLVSE